MSVGALRQRGGGTECPEDCNGNGVCNSKGHCHCAKGFAPPLCKYPGTGGSQDSGPASDPNGEHPSNLPLVQVLILLEYSDLERLFLTKTRKDNWPTKNLWFFSVEYLKSPYLNFAR